jgi:CubicO group peptidase (beta-lactamase class C family)
MKTLIAALCFAIVCSAHAAETHAAEAHAAETSGVMVGAPPPPDELVTRANWLAPPYSAWAFQHIEAVVPTTTVDRGANPVSALDTQHYDLSKFQFTDAFGKTRTLEQFLNDMHIDALALWSDGKVRQEIYRHGQTDRSRHIMMSVTKSFTGLIAEMLIAEGKLDETKLVTDYVPELKGSAYDGATMRDLLNMEIGIDYTEVYDDPMSSISQYIYAAGLVPAPPGVKTYPSLYEFLPSLQKKGEHGKDFHYVTANSEVLGWVIEKITGTGFVNTFRDKVYGKIGAERDAFYVTDPHGKALAGGGLNITARDGLRLGVMMSHEGKFNGQQIVPAAVVAKIVAGSTPRPSLWGNENGGHDHSYMSQWYVNNATHVVSAQGIHGQTIHFLPKQDIALVMQSSYPNADGPFFIVLDNFFDAVAKEVKGKH